MLMVVTVVAVLFVRDLISFILYIILSVRNLVASESYGCLQVYVSLSSLYNF